MGGRVKLLELEPQFMRVTEPKKRYANVDDLASAQGLLLLCPACFTKNGDSNIGVHSVLVWFRDRGVPDDEEPLPGRWEVSGTGYADLTLKPSVHVTKGCMWHGFITAGEVT